MKPASPAAGFEERVRASYARQRFMQTIGAVLNRVEAGAVEIAMPYRPELTQQHGFVHAGVVATLLDTACGYAAFSLMPADAAVLTVEYKINLLRPAQGEQLIARARVTRAGQTLTVCTGDAFMQSDGEEKAVATMLAAVMAVTQQGGLRQ